MDLLLEDLRTLGGDSYATTDAREAVYLIRYMFAAPQHSAVVVAVKAERGPGTFSALGPTEDTLIASTIQGASSGKMTRMVFVVPDWLSAMADENSTRVLRDLADHGVMATVVPGTAASGHLPGAFAVFADPHGRPSVCRFLPGLGGQQTLPFSLSYEPRQCEEYIALFQSLWTAEGGRRVRVL